jgi:hypothetical protein
MNNRKVNITLAIITVVFSMGIYYLQILIYKDPKTTFFYLLQDLAFVPISVALVTLVFNKLLSNREKMQKIKHNNVVITTFFVEVGTEMILHLTKFNVNHHDFRKNITTVSLNNSNIADTKKLAKDYAFMMEARNDDLEKLKRFLAEKRSFLLNILSNTTLLEHDTFTDMLWAIFHIADELQSRDDLKGLPATDLDHLSLDLLRAYKLLILEWLDYLKYLSKAYPYIFSLAIRKNPFSDVIDVRIKS